MTHLTQTMNGLQKPHKEKGENEMKIKGIEQIKGIVADIRAKYPRITDEMLLDDGKITYANGNDSTSFDWSCNDRLCEFMVYHNSGYSPTRLFLFLVVPVFVP